MTTPIIRGTASTFIDTTATPVRLSASGTDRRAAALRTAASPALAETASWGWREILAFPAALLLAAGLATLYATMIVTLLNNQLRPPAPPQPWGYLVADGANQDPGLWPVR